MTFTISADDPRTIRAIELAADAEYWLKGRNPAGEDVFGVPSQADPRHYYIVTASTCDCLDFARGQQQACKHMLAVRLYRELVRAQQRPSRPTPPRPPRPPRERGHLTVVNEP